jgi:hypothetical protein
MTACTSSTQKRPPLWGAAFIDPHLWFTYWIGLLLVLDKKRVTRRRSMSVARSIPLTAWFAQRLIQADSRAA